jgi:hypothetical protein
MSPKNPRPSVINLDNLMVKPATPNPASAPDETPQPKPEPGLSPTFRTSVYFHRAVHDVLRDIAYHERKSITDLINEGLDHVLASRSYPSTAKLRDGGKGQ